MFRFNYEFENQIIDKWNKNQFELISILNKPFINGKALFKRLIIKKIV